MRYLIVEYLLYQLLAEVDFTISDFVSDMRAPTPSAAGELVSPSLQEMINDLLNKKSSYIELLTENF